jgi:2-phospho-L-lactate/phosphoenolpyruvate guanylyltransferase
VRALLVPLKSFTKAKARLSESLDDGTRVILIQRLAAHVLKAAGSLPAFVVCDDGAVADWSIRQGASALYAPGLGLNGAVSAGVELLGRLGFELIVVAHADLPFVEALDSFGAEGGVTIAPDRRDDGTNVIALPSGAPFHFSYGPGSFARHLREAHRLGLVTRVVRNPRFATDVDLPADLAEFGESLFAGSASAVSERGRPLGE